MFTEASTTAAHASPGSADGAARLLRDVAASGLLHCALPVALGGIGGSLADLAEGAADLAVRHRAAAWILRAQRLAIEAVAASPNVGLREYLLPDLLSGERAASVPLPLSAAPLVGVDTGRGWRLDGLLPCVSNWQWMGCSIVAPVRLGTAAGWVVLRSEESGLQPGPPQGDAEPPALSRSIALQCKGVFFREDEWLGGPELAERLAPLAQALAPTLQQR